MKTTLIKTPSQNCHFFMRALYQMRLPPARYNLHAWKSEPTLRPDFELPDLNGRPRSNRLSDYRGRIVIVNFWSCECPHSERTDRAIMAMFVQWREDVVLLPIAANRIEIA